MRAVIVLLIVVFASPVVAQAAVMPYKFTRHQMIMYKKLIKEARRQDVPVGFVLANADVETQFKDIPNRFGTAFGPLQLHKSALFPYEMKHHRKIDWNIRKSVAMLKDLLIRAKGKTYWARVMFFCGPNFTYSCSAKAIAVNSRRWIAATARWNVPEKYAL